VTNSKFMVQSSACVSPASSPGVPPGVRTGSETLPQPAAGTATLHYHPTPSGNTSRALTRIRDPAIRFMLRPGSVARPALARAFTTKLSWAGSPQRPTLVMTEWLIVIYHCRTFTGRTDSLMGCEQRTRRFSQRPQRKIRLGVPLRQPSRPLR